MAEGTAPARGSAAAAAAAKQRRRNTSGGAAASPPPAIGGRHLLEFYSQGVHAKGFEMTPRTVLLASFGFIAFVFLLHAMAKFHSVSTS